MAGVKKIYFIFRFTNLFATSDTGPLRTTGFSNVIISIDREANLRPILQIIYLCEVAARVMNRKFRLQQLSDRNSSTDGS